MGIHDYRLTKLDRFYLIILNRSWYPQPLPHLEPHVGGMGSFEKISGRAMYPPPLKVPLPPFSGMVNEVLNHNVRGSIMTAYIEDGFLKGKKAIELWLEGER